ncbi:hypothetical protein KTD19_04805 [Burkholderia multivorans]|uniref:hypothetical protein n=1 Tax=Burkholderia multivorans TaxID=87883 RepID=UPI0012DE3571|nr:hypothetical protein [Burkholderia multivorans]MBU9231700.1 hypothetical protein [Burkholderia multivorans]QGR91128.1 hypothetical protein FOC30_09440 [Burkholderia multivorans]HEF4737564.1 hypothetical protein [Burkholderia multivorans]
MRAVRVAADAPPPSIRDRRARACTRRFHDGSISIDIDIDIDIDIASAQRMRNALPPKPCKSDIQIGIDYFRSA